MKGLAFYEAAATAIPLLTLVVFLLEPRGLQRVWPYLPKWLRLLVLFEYALVAFAEWRALHVLLTEHAARLDVWIVSCGLVGLAVGLIAASTGNPFAPTKTLPTKELDDLRLQVERLRRDIEEGVAEAMSTAVVPAEEELLPRAPHPGRGVTGRPWSGSPSSRAS